MPTSQELLRMKYLKQLQDIADSQSDYGEQIKTGYALNGMEGGFGANEQRKMQTEAGALKTDITKGYQLESDYLKKIEADQKEAARRQKLGGMLQAGGTILGAALAPLTGGLSVAGGAALGGTLGSIGNTLYGTGSAPSIDLSFIDDFNNMKARKDLLKLRQDYQATNFEESLPLEPKNWE